ncbi:MAG: Holliday junction branch migration protein RuvA [Thermotaleaceae bacterium]
MFHFIKGNPDFFGEDFVVIENNAIGYKIFTSLTTMTSVRQLKANVMMYTQLVVREDDMSLFGFHTREELKMFQLLTTVSGVGAKVALGILSSIEHSQLAEIIHSEDVNSLTKAHGVGKKTAQRIILELKEKIDIQDVAAIRRIEIPETLGNIQNEAVEALVALGYGKNEAELTVSQVSSENNSTEKIIKAALKTLAR